MKGKSRMEVKFDSEAGAKAALSALKQEEEFKKRSISKVTAVGSSIIIEVNAEDVVALRATANSYLRALQAMEAVGNANINDNE